MGEKLRIKVVGLLVVHSHYVPKWCGGILFPVDVQPTLPPASTVQMLTDGLLFKLHFTIFIHCTHLNWLARIWATIYEISATFGCVFTIVTGCVVVNSGSQTGQSLLNHFKPCYTILYYIILLLLLLYPRFHFFTTSQALIRVSASSPVT